MDQQSVDGFRGIGACHTRAGEGQVPPLKGDTAAAEAVEHVGGGVVQRQSTTAVERVGGGATEEHRAVAIEGDFAAVDGERASGVAQVAGQRQITGADLGQGKVNRCSRGEGTCEGRAGVVSSDCQCSRSSSIAVRDQTTRGGSVTCQGAEEGVVGIEVEFSTSSHHESGGTEDLRCTELQHTVADGCRTAPVVASTAQGKDTCAELGQASGTDHTAGERAGHCRAAHRDLARGAAEIDLASQGQVVRVEQAAEGEVAAHRDSIRHGLSSGTCEHRGVVADGQRANAQRAAHGRNQRNTHCGGGAVGTHDKSAGVQLHAAGEVTGGAGEDDGTSAREDEACCCSCATHEVADLTGDGEVIRGSSRGVQGQVRASEFDVRGDGRRGGQVIVHRSHTIGDDQIASSDVDGSRTTGAIEGDGLQRVVADQRQGACTVDNQVAGAGDGAVGALSGTGVVENQIARDDDGTHWVARAAEGQRALVHHGLAGVGFREGHQSGR